MRYSTKFNTIKKIKKFIGWLLTPVEKVCDRIETI